MRLIIANARVSTQVIINRALFPNFKGKAIKPQAKIIKIENKEISKSPIIKSKNERSTTPNRKVGVKK